jgi:cytochrome P450/NADPH-cytochrome P450 reductase
MTVLANRELQRRDCARPSERSTRHLEIALPKGVTYQAGEHLGIVPIGRPKAYVQLSTGTRPGGMAAAAARR